MKKITILSNGKQIHTLDIVHAQVENELCDIFDVVLDKEKTCTAVVKYDIGKETMEITLQKDNKVFAGFRACESISFELE